MCNKCGFFVKRKAIMQNGINPVDPKPLVAQLDDIYEKYGFSSKNPIYGTMPNKDGVEVFWRNEATRWEDTKKDATYAFSNPDSPMYKIINRESNKDGDIVKIQCQKIVKNKTGFLNKLWNFIKTVLR